MGVSVEEKAAAAPSDVHLETETHKESAGNVEERLVLQNNYNLYNIKS